MRYRLGIAVLMVVGQLSLRAQAARGDEDFHVYRDAPRIHLTAQRLRLLERERERNAVRWQALDDWTEAAASGAPLPEPGFAWSLHYAISKQEASARRAITWAMTVTDDKSSDPATLRQLAIVFDWCSPAMRGGEAEQIAKKLEQGIAVSRDASNMTTHAARVLAAIALADRLPDAGDAVLRQAVAWWRAHPDIPRAEAYAQAEFLHAVRDNTKVDLRAPEEAPNGAASEDNGPASSKGLATSRGRVAYFNRWPLDYIAGFYPASFPGPENDLRIPAYESDGDPDIAQASLARAAGLAMVGYDTTAVNYQFAQGFLMNDRFILRDPLGAPYEFLWANPYQPGLAYQTLPLVFHDPETGRVFARTSWEEDATWVGYFGVGSVGTGAPNAAGGAIVGNEPRVLQMFRDRGLQQVRSGTPIAPLHVGDAMVTRPANPPVAPRAPQSGPLYAEPLRVRMDVPALFVLGLAPDTEYAVEIDDQELDFLRTDVGGTLVVRSTAGVNTSVDAGVRVTAR